MAKIEPPQGVVFDLDGLMFNTEDLYQEVGNQLLEKRGKSFTQSLKDKIMGRPSPVALQIMIDHHHLETTVEQLEKESADIFDILLPQRLERMPGLTPLLERIDARGIPRAIATGSRRSFVSKVLGLGQLEDSFRFVLTSEDISQGKPHPEIYLLAASRLELNPAQIVVFEDSANGCRSAVDAGTRAIAIPGISSRHHDFSGAALVADSLSDPRIAPLLGLS